MLTFTLMVPQPNVILLRAGVYDSSVMILLHVGVLTVSLDTTSYHFVKYLFFFLLMMHFSPLHYRVIGTVDASRCFNCGSYNHSLKECPKPRDNAAVNSARKQHNSKRNLPAGSRLPTRYYQNSPGGKFDGLRAGVLGAETRQCLGIGASWLTLHFIVELFAVIIISFFIVACLMSVFFFPF